MTRLPARYSEKKTNWNERLNNYLGSVETIHFQVSDFSLDTDTNHLVDRNIGKKISVNKEIRKSIRFFNVLESINKYRSLAVPTRPIFGSRSLLIGDLNDC
jgi:hypothetical protein